MRSERGGAGNRLRPVLVLAGVALLSWAAWTIVGGAAGVLYGAASGTALLGLLFFALRRQRSTREGRADTVEPADAPAPTAAPIRRAARPLPGVRMIPFVRELEEENRLLREELAQRLEALRTENELRARGQALHEEALNRLERNLRHHSRERALLETELQTIFTGRPSAPMEAVGAGRVDAGT
jgi:hypothetical protein